MSSFAPVVISSLGQYKRQISGAAAGVLSSRIGSFYLFNDRGSSNTPIAYPASLPQKNIIKMPPYARKLVKTRKRKSTKKGKKLATVATVRRMLGTQTELKHKSGAFALTNLVAGSIYTANITAQVAQGTLDGNRVGDEIYMKQLHCNIVFNTDPVASAYIYRVLVVYGGEEYNPSSVAFSTAGYAFTEAFLPGSYSGTAAFSLTNPKGVTVLRDELITMNSLISSTSDSVCTRIVVNLNKKMKYQSSGSVFGRANNVYVIVAAYVNGAAADSGDIVMNYKLSYTDP